MNASLPTNTMMPRRTDTSLLDDSASSLSRYSNTSTNVSHTRANPIDISDYRPAKRRKGAGLNMRFDRMINSVNTMLPYGNRSPVASRKRMQSSGTSSVSSHDLPKTPVDAYSSLHPGKLGKDFSVLKMKKSPLLPREASDGFAKPAAPPRNPLPDWLANTFCSLEAGHPLRGLLSPSRINPESESNSPPPELRDISREEEVFAFSPSKFDKQEEVPVAAYRADSAWNNVSSVVPAEPTQSYVWTEASTNPLPFSTPGCYAPVRKSIESSVTDGTFQKPLLAIPQQATSHATNTMHLSALPASYSRTGDAAELPQFTPPFSNIAHDSELPSDFREHGAYISHDYQVFGGGGDNFNVYATPGPTFACSRPVYFDSPTEDPSLSDPLQPESYELDLNATDFRWRPFLRSNAQESNTNRRFVSPSSSLGYALPNQVGDQSGWNPCFVVDQREYGAYSKELPCLAEGVEIGHVNDVSVIPPSNVNRSSTTNNLIGPWSSPINDVQQVPSAFARVPGVFLSPLRDQPESALLAAHVEPRGDGENIQPGDEFPLLHGGAWLMESEDEIGPSTPIRQVRVSPPSTPQKVRSSQLCGTRAPVRKTSSALSRMMPLKFANRTVAGQDHGRLSRVSVNSHDSIESWGEMS